MATTTSYCRTSDVVKLLPDTLPNFLTTGSYGHMVEIIEETSALVRDACHNFYSAFPGTTDPLGTADLDTPARVKIITQYLAAQRCRDEIGVVQEKTQVGTYLHDKAMELLKEVLPRMNAAGEVIGELGG